MLAGSAETHHPWGCTGRETKAGWLVYPFDFGQPPGAPGTMKIKVKISQHTLPGKVIEALPFYPLKGPLCAISRIGHFLITMLSASGSKAYPIWLSDTTIP